MTTASIGLRFKLIVRAVNQRTNLVRLGSMVTGNNFIAQKLGSPLWPSDMEPGIARPAGVRYQPFVDIRTQQTIGFEALLRMKGVAGKPCAPSADWLSELECEKDGLPLVCWLYTEVLSLPAQTSSCFRRCYIDVNIRPTDLLHPAFYDATVYVDYVIKQKGYAGLQLEIVERHAVFDFKRTAAAIDRCQQSGIEVALDDFGTGMASLQHLYSLPCSTVKIDRFFTSHLEDPRMERLVVDLILLCHHQKRKVLIEGIENDRQLAFFHRLGVEQAQGYLFGKAVDAGEMHSYMC